MSFRGSISKLIMGFERSFQTLNVIEVDREQILANYDRISNAVAGEGNKRKEVWPVLKANAYGHGLHTIAGILKARKFSYLVVDSYFEALRVHEVSKQPVLMMGYTLPSNFPKMDFRNLAQVVYDLESIRALGRLRRAVKVHLKINTGMNRQGLLPEALPGILAELAKYPNIELEGVCSHLADADNADDTFTRKQVDCFENAFSIIKEKGFNPKFVHIGNTAGSAKVDVGNAVRAGIGLYGISPLLPADPSNSRLEKLKPALKFVSTLVNIIDLKPGECVGYGCAFTAKAAMKIGVVPVGYYEGVDLRLGNKGNMQVGEKFVPIVGKVCMNMTMIDLTSLHAEMNVKTGDKVTVISDNASAPNSIVSIARTCETIPYEVLVQLAESTRRVAVV